MKANPRLFTIIAMGMIIAAAMPTIGSAQLVPGPVGIGRIEHATYSDLGGASGPFLTKPSSVGAAGAGLQGVPDPFFNPVTADGGAMLSPGFGYPTLIGNPIGFNDTGPTGLLPNVRFSALTQAPGFVPLGMTSAGTSMIPLGGGGRAGVALTTNFVHDAPPGGNGVASVSTFAADVEYKNGLIPQIGRRLGHGISGTFSVPFNQGYTAAAVNSVFEYDPGGCFGAGFGRLACAPGGAVNPGAQWWEPLPVIGVFSGLNSVLAPAVQAGSFAFSFPNAQTMRFSGVSAVPFLVNILPGASLRFRSTVTLIDDAGGSFELDAMPIEYQNLFDIGLGGSTDADTWIGVPEPSCGLLLFSAVAIAAAMRRFRHSA